MLPLTQKIRDKNISLTKHILPPNIEIRTDEHLLEQVLYNLILNAIDYSSNGCSIVIEAQLIDNTFTCSLRDEGTGMPFTPDPHTLSPGPSTKRFGTGLGIPFAFKVCEVLGGNITFEAALPQGTLITLSLPQ